MSILGKIHEISFYGMITSFLCLIKNKVSLATLFHAAFNPHGFAMFFKAFLFWSMVLFIPIAVIGAFVTKYLDNGEGLTFNSDNIIVIMFGHIGEEILGLFLTPFWFLKDLFTQNFDAWKIIDYVTYSVELIFILIGILVI